MPLQEQQTVAAPDSAHPASGLDANTPMNGAANRAVPMDSFASMVRHDLDRAAASPALDAPDGAPQNFIMLPEEANAELRRQIDALLSAEIIHAEEQAGREEPATPGAQGAREAPADAVAHDPPPAPPVELETRAEPAPNAVADETISPTNESVVGPDTEAAVAQAEDAKTPAAAPEKVEEVSADLALDDGVLDGVIDDIEAVPQPFRPLDDAAGATAAADPQVEKAYAAAEQEARDELRARIAQQKAAQEKAGRTATDGAPDGADRRGSGTPPAVAASASAENANSPDAGQSPATTSAGAEASGVAAKDQPTVKPARNRPGHWALAALRLANLPFTALPDDLKAYIGVAGAVLAVGGIALMLLIHFHVLGQ